MATLAMLERIMGRNRSRRRKRKETEKGNEK